MLRLFLVVLLFALNIDGNINYKISNNDKSQVLIQFSTLGGGNPTGAGSYNVGQEVTITAYPWIGRRFVLWLDFDSDTVFSLQEQYTFTATTDIILRPLYEYDTYNINIIINPDNSGIIITK